MPVHLLYLCNELRVSTARIRALTEKGPRPVRRDPSNAMVPPGGFENDTRRKLAARAPTARTRPAAATGKRPRPKRRDPSNAMVPPGGFEPSTPALGERCSIP